MKQLVVTDNDIDTDKTPTQTTWTSLPVSLSIPTIYNYVTSK